MSTDGWRQGLQHLLQNLRETPRDSGQVPACCHTFYSPEPIRQQRNLPDEADFHELSLLYPYRNSNLWRKLPVVLRRNPRLIESLYTFIPEGQYDTVSGKYRTAATELQNIVFGGMEQARRSFGLTDDHLTPCDLWTLFLFRLATLQIDGFGLLPHNVSNVDDVFQTLWPVSMPGTNVYETISFNDLLDGESLLLPELYTGSAWILNEMTGMLHVPADNLVESIQCTLHFSPPLVLFGTSSIDQEHPVRPPLVYYAWTSENRNQTVTITREDGTPLDGFNTKRISGLRPLFSYQAGWADDHGNDRFRNKEYMQTVMRFEGNATIYELEREYLHAPTTKTTHSFPFYIVFQMNGDEDDVRLIVWPHESEESRLRTPVLNAKHRKASHRLLHSSFIQRKFPLLRPMRPDAIWTQSIRLADAERIVEIVHRSETFQYSDYPSGDWLPQQRITNTVQIFDNLFESSAKAVNIILTKGRDWIRESMSRTAAVFTEMWEEGDFSTGGCRAIISRISEDIGTLGLSQSGQNVSDDQQSCTPTRPNGPPIAVRQPGRPPSPRGPWIMERHQNGLSPSEIVNEWNQGGKELWEEIDPETPTPYQMGNEGERRKSVNRVRSAIARAEQRGQG